MIFLINFLWIDCIVCEDAFDYQILETKYTKLKVEPFSDGFDIPWGMALLPDSNMLVTDLSGSLYKVFIDGRTTLIKGTPDVFYKGQGGLLDVEIHPDFLLNNIVFISYSQPKGKKAFTALAQAKLINDKLESFKILYSAKIEHFSKKSIHFGSRIAIDDNFIYFSIGDRGERDEAQNLNTPNGKIHRLYLNGEIPDDNPFKTNDGKPNSIWCYGNRNPQGLAFSKDGTLWELEHGPRGGDELNIIQKGLNYGWPKITYGINYIGTKISDYTHMDGMEQPIWHWTPSIALCGMAIYENSLIPEWKGNILVTSLKYEFLERVIIKNGERIGNEIIYEAGSRVRDVEIGPDGTIYIALENPGRIVKITKYN